MTEKGVQKRGCSGFLIAYLSPCGGETGEDGGLVRVARQCEAGNCRTFAYLLTSLLLHILRSIESLQRFFCASGQTSDDAGPFSLRMDIFSPMDSGILTGSLNSKNAFITGSGRGIGREMALALAKAVTNVAITGLTASGANETKEQILKLGSVKAISVIAGMLSRDGQKRLAQGVEAELGAIDILIANADSNIFQPFHLTDPASWWGVMEMNARAPVELTRLVLPSMQAHNTGTIIYTSSRAATADLPWTTSYTCAKTTMTRLAGTIQAELDQVQRLESGVSNGISVFSVHPWEVDTNLQVSGAMLISAPMITPLASATQFSVTQFCIISAYRRRRWLITSINTSPRIQAYVNQSWPTAELRTPIPVCHN